MTHYLLNGQFCKELIDVGINAIDEFKIRTNIGEHKVSMFLRNVYKYCAEVDYWYLDKEKCIDKCIRYILK